MPFASGTISRRRRHSVWIIGIALILLIYFFLYPIFCTAAWYQLIDTDHGLGRMVYLLYFPMRKLVEWSPAVNDFCQWLYYVYEDAGKSLLR